MARRVVVVGVHRGNDLVDPIDVIQETGRCGRKGMDSKGDAYILLPKDKFIELREKYKKSPPIISRIIPNCPEGIDNLIFHVVSEIAEGNIKNEMDFIEWYSRSLAAYQGCKIEKEDASILFNLLEKIRAIKKDGSCYVATGLGKVSSVMYMSPYNVYEWYKNFSFLFKEREDLANNDLGIVWGIANCRMYDVGYVNANDLDYALMFVSMCKKEKLEIDNSKAVNGYMLTACCGYEKLEAQIEKQRAYVIRMDIERVLQTIALIDSLYANWGRKNLWDKLGIRFTYGVLDKYVDLCRLRGIGAVRSRLLYSVGVRNRTDMIGSKELCIKILGNDDRARKIYEEAIGGR